MKGTTTRGKDMTTVMSNYGFGDMYIRSGGKQLHIPAYLINKTNGLLKKRVSNLLVNKDYTKLKELGVVVH